MKKSTSCFALIASLLIMVMIAFAGQADNVTRKLAYKLVQEGDHRAAAIEYRRLALTAQEPEQRAGYYWAAAYEYWKASDHELVEKMLDLAEDNSQKLTAESLLLRAEAALSAENFEEAKFYLQSIIDGQACNDAKAIAATRLARALCSEGDLSSARESLLISPYDNSAGLAALDCYGGGRDKTPLLGGLLGLVPGLGYAYSGEYANALRSLILNGLFIYAMIDTAGDEEWGAFTAISFFEITWYSGSVYGGIDAAHRYNRNRLNNCVEAIDGGSGFSLDLKQIPIVSLNFQF